MSFEWFHWSHLVSLPLPGYQGSFATLWGHDTPLVITSSSPYKPNVEQAPKMTAKRGRANEEPAHNYNHEKFVNESAAERFGLISKNRSFIKEKGFHHSEDFFSQNHREQGVAGTMPTLYTSCHYGCPRILRQSRFPHE